MKKNTIRILVLALLALALAGAIGILYTYRDHQKRETAALEGEELKEAQDLVAEYDGKCYGGKWIDRREAEGLTEKELTQMLNNAGDRRMADTATITVDGERNTFSMKDLNAEITYHCSDGSDYARGEESKLAAKLVRMDKDRPLSEQVEIINEEREPTELTVTTLCQSSKKGMTSAMKTLTDRYVIPATDSRISKQGVINKPKDGKDLDIQTIQRELENYLSENPDGGYTASYRTTVVKPTWLLEDVEQVRTVISHHSTTFQPGTNRGYNIRLAASRLHGTFLLPGEKVSFLKIFYDDSDGKKYKKAGALYRGKSVQARGGGNCQVSSTAYMACLKAGILPVKRYPHTKPVNYVPMGLDAALSVGGKDLVIENTLDQPVWILAGTKGDTLLVQFVSCKGVLKGYQYSPGSKKISSKKAKSFLDVYREKKKEKRIPLYTDIYQ